MTFTGTGDGVVQVPAAFTTKPAVVHISGNSAGDADFTVRAGSQLLVSTTKRYDGYVPLNFEAGEHSTSIAVGGSDPWTMTLTTAAGVPTFSSTITYYGDRVLRYVGKAGVAAITGNANGVAEFVVKEYEGNNVKTLVSTAHPYAGRVPIRAGPELLVISAGSEDSWTIDTAPT